MPFPCSSSPTLATVESNFPASRSKNSLLADISEIVPRFLLQDAAITPSLVSTANHSLIPARHSSCCTPLTVPLEQHPPKSNIPQLPTSPNFQHPPTSNILLSDPRLFSEELILEENVCKKISMKEIYAATNNLHAHNFIGQGISGKVYKGFLNGWHVAIKHIIKEGQAETFLREVTNLSHVRHPNLVILRGYCEIEHECFLVYELCSNGSLSEWLFGKQIVLSWLQRLKIAIGSARGLHFLHTYEGGCIVHRDIKPANILLADNFEAKLSDFGLSKLMEPGVSHVSSEVRGTFGYVDPEYRRNHHVNSAGDVYSFGMVLLQIISGKRMISLDMTMPASLDKLAISLSNGNTSNFADPRMNGEFSVEAFDLVLKLAISCTAHKRLRPAMEQVVKKLEKALEISARSSDVYSVSFS